MTTFNRIPDLIKELEYLTTHFVEVGIFSDSTREDGTPMLVIAYVHEFGTEFIPERSYLRAGFDENQDKIQEEFEYLLGQVLDLKLSGKAALELIGASVTTKIQKYLVDLKIPPLKPATIKAKGSSNPLVDTGQLMNSITWKIAEVPE